MWRKRLASLLLAVLLLPAVGLAEETAAWNDLDQRVDDWALVRQNDPRYDIPRYKYCGANLSVRGCGPVSIANALIAAFGVTEREETDLLLRETLVMLAEKHSPAYFGMYPKNMAEFMTVDEENYPTLTRLKQTYDVYQYTDKCLTLPEIRERLTPAMNANKAAMLIGKIDQDTRWQVLTDTCGWLHEIGRGDALVLITYVSAGTRSTEAPFCTNDGHFVTLAIQPDEFARCGGVYLLDSLPRAIKGEEYENGTYWSQYNYVRLLLVNKPFRDTFDVMRVKPTSIKMTFKQEWKDELETLSGEARRARETELLAPMKLYGEGIFMICLPAKAE